MVGTKKSIFNQILIILKTIGPNSKPRFSYPFSMIFIGFEALYKYLQNYSCRIFDRYQISNRILGQTRKKLGFTLSIENADFPAPVLLVDRAVNRQPDFRPETSVSRM